MPIQFKFLRIDVPQFAILAEDVSGGPFGVSFGINFAIGEKSIIKCSLKVVYLKESQPVTQLVVDTFFAIEEKSWEEMKQDRKVVVPVAFLQHLAALTVSTARGIQYEKTTDIGINNYLIPLTNLTEIIKDDMVIEECQ